MQVSGRTVRAVEGSPPPLAPRRPLPRPAARVRFGSYIGINGSYISINGSYTRVHGSYIPRPTARVRPANSYSRRRFRPVLHGNFAPCRSSAIPLCLSCTFVRFRTERKIDDFAIPDRPLYWSRTGHVHNWSCDRNPSRRFDATIDTQSIKTQQGPLDSNHTTLQDSS